ncbi:MAG: TSUP family transporter [Aquificota bacterium]|nr:MAG: TSUP family transporter [Aquificota bacterium]
MGICCGTYLFHRGCCGWYTGWRGTSFHLWNKGCKPCKVLQSVLGSPISSNISTTLSKTEKGGFWLAFWLAVGSVLGASAGAFLSYQYLKDIRQYKYLFGLLTLFIGIKVLYEAFGSKKLVKTYKDLSTGLKGLRIELRQGEEVKSISIFNPFFVGFGIAMLSSAMGVGGWLFDSSLYAVGSEAFGLLCTWHCSFGRFYNHLDRHAKLLQAWCGYQLEFFA